MERRDRSTIVSIRIPDGLLEKIESDIEDSGDFTSRADYILSAIRHYEAYRVQLKKDRECDFTPSSGLQFGTQVKDKLEG